MRRPPVILSIAGYDPSSGAGITADIKTAAVQGCYAVTCITALTVQSTQGVFRVQSLQPELVAQTLAALADDFEIAAVRVGMLGSGPVSAAVASFLDSGRPPNVVLDPVIHSSSGAPLLDEIGMEVLRAIMPLCDIVTPNVNEAAALAGAEPVSPDAPWEEVLPRIRKIGGKLRELGSRAVVVTGGHLAQANDYLFYQEAGSTREEVFPGTHLDSQSTHGTGCAFATALACRLALGNALPEAVRAAKEYVHKAIMAAYPIGKGIGPINHGM
jgi:hydroxymethylpyrimidine/phosphomethylpyrimidine kinase